MNSITIYYLIVHSEHVRHVLQTEGKLGDGLKSGWCEIVNKKRVSVVVNITRRLVFIFYLIYSHTAVCFSSIIYVGSAFYTIPFYNREEKLIYVRGSHIAKSKLRAILLVSVHFINPTTKAAEDKQPAFNWEFQVCIQSCGELLDNLIRIFVFFFN